MVTKRQIRNWKRYCVDYTKIPGYDKAVNDKTGTRYVCHHILEILLGVSKNWLVEHDLYDQQPPCLLQIMTFGEHSRMHIDVTAKSFGGGLMLGKQHSEEAKKKVSAAMSSLPYEKGHRYIAIEKSVLYDLYCVKHMPITKIASVLDITRPTVRKKLRYFNIY